ncbi:MAG: alpha-L-rhamnosidase N-terminal domain-containing protein, partial [Clostridia bacterium]|nr:alpha-L-rhamnosidase N-terminal domain-containing protein [Clostridia bacterium]
MVASAAPFFGAKYMKATACAPSFSDYDPLPLFRATVHLHAPVADARMALYSPGFCVCYINGRPVTEDVFTSPVSDYRKNLWYTEYDVTSLLSEGENAVCVIAGNGFLNESFSTCWGFHTASWRDAPKCLLALSVNGDCVLQSGADFRTSREHSHIIFSHLRSGERWDMRKLDSAWLYAGFDDSSWALALVSELPEGAVLRPTLCPPVRECEHYEPVAVTPVDGGCVL